MKYIPITIFSLLAAMPLAFAQNSASCGTHQDLSGFDCVTLLDSTAVNVQETGSGSFSVHKNFKLLTEA